MDKELIVRLLSLYDYLRKIGKVRSQLDFCNKMGIGTSLFTEIKKGRSGISRDRLQNITESLIMYKYWLFTGEGEILKSPEVTTDQPYTINQKQQGVPYYDVDFVGGFDVVVNDQTANPAYHINFAEYSKADCWVNVTGHSMEPTISHGDIVALRELKEWEDHILLGEIYAIVTNEYRTLKKVRKSSKGDDYLLIIPTNKDYDEQDIPKRIIRKVYQVLGAAKKIF